MRYLILVTLLAFEAMAGARTVAVHGHRGSRGYYPENTLPAFAHALKVGVNVLELDTGITKDEQVIVSHDPVINPRHCLDKDGKVVTSKVILKNITLKEVKEYDCGALKNSDFPKQTPVPKTSIPTLSEVFELATKDESLAASKVLFNIETKIEPGNPELYTDPGKFVKLLYAVIKKHGMEKRVIIQSFDFRTLVEIRKLDRRIPISLLLSDEPGDLAKLVKEYKPNIVSPNFKWVKEKHVNALKKLGVQTIPWTPNRESDWKKLIKMKVDGIITDYPDDLIRFQVPFSE